MLLRLLLLFTGSDHTPLRGQQPKASGFAGGSLLWSVPDCARSPLPFELLRELFRFD
jgi:hypothetical protein